MVSSLGRKQSVCLTRIFHACLRRLDFSRGFCDDFQSSNGARVRSRWRTAPGANEPLRREPMCHFHRQDVAFFDITRETLCGGRSSIKS